MIDLNDLPMIEQENKAVGKKSIFSNPLLKLPLDECGNHVEDSFISVESTTSPRQV